MKVGHLDQLEIETQFKVGTLVKFKYTPKGALQSRYSYSKITKILPKVDESHTVRLHFLTENEKFIEQDQIISVERKADND